jgi:triphosphoribosyl-dephospho-CoA synthase
VNNQEKAQHISKCFQLAILLEVSSEKPGNVNLTSSFEGTTCQHFLASAIAAGSSLQEAAYRGSQVMESNVGIDKVGLGHLIKTCTSDVKAWQRGGNTILGTIMLFVPMAAAAGMTPAKKDFSLDLLEMRKNIDKLISASTASDSVHLYEAIAIANPSGLNKSADLDVNDPASKQRLIQENVTLLQVFKIGADYDDISNEWVNNFPVTFDLGYTFLKEQLKTKPLNTAIVHTFLKILSERPDTFIARKVGRQKAIEVSADAKVVLELGGLETEKGTKSLHEFDRRLRQSQNKCNPGTTADLTAAALALCTLSGYRP